MDKIKLRRLASVSKARHLAFLVSQIMESAVARKEGMEPHFESVPVIKLAWEVIHVGSRGLLLS